jgi:hypothetical protein
MRLSLVAVARRTQDTWRSNASWIAHIVIVECILKSQHLIVTNMWRIVELVGIGVIFALIKMI